MLTIVERIKLGRKMREQLGPDAVRIIEQRARVHAQEGDRDAAELWRGIAHAVRELDSMGERAFDHGVGGLVT
jgi:hypothetical protein